MKKFTALVGLFIISWSFLCLAQVGVPPVAPIALSSPVISTPVVAPVVVPPLTFFGFIKANWGQVCFALSWIIEGVFYFSPSLKANGLLEQVELWIKGQSVTPTL